MQPLRSMLPLAARAAAALACAALAACGPSAAEVKRAHDAHYHAPIGPLYDGAKAGAEAEHYRIGHEDFDGGVFEIFPKYWGPEGQTENVGGAGRLILDNTIAISYVVRLVPDDGGASYALVIEPHIRRFHTDRPNPDEVPVGSVDLPGWVPGKIDQLWLAIHEQLAAYEAKPGA